MRGDLSRKTKSFQTEFRLANQIGRINVIQHNFSHFDIIQNL